MCHHTVIHAISGQQWQASCVIDYTFLCSCFSCGDRQSGEAGGFFMSAEQFLNSSQHGSLEHHVGHRKVKKQAGHVDKGCNKRC